MPGPLAWPLAAGAAWRAWIAETLISAPSLLARSSVVMTRWWRRAESAWRPFRMASLRLLAAAGRVVIGSLRRRGAAGRVMGMPSETAR